MPKAKSKAKKQILKRVGLTLFFCLISFPGQADAFFLGRWFSRYTPVPKQQRARQVTAPKLEFDPASISQTKTATVGQGKELRFTLRAQDSSGGTLTWRILHVPDVNGDGTINIADVQRIWQIKRALQGEITQTPSDQEKQLADLNNDGNVTFADISLAVDGFILGGEPNLKISSDTKEAYFSWVAGQYLSTRVITFKVTNSSGLSAQETIKVTVIPLLSISVNPKIWDIGTTEVNKVLTMTAIDKIIVTNDGNAAETFGLSLINPEGWTASGVADKEAYVLSAIFCNANAVPDAAHFNQDSSSEDVITAAEKKATSTVFAYSQSAANGVAVPSSGSRSLYLQFKSPTITQKKEGQDISVIVSCQIP